MSDLISRQAAITLPVMPKEHREYQTQNLDDAYEQGWFDLQECIEKLPSAQQWISVSERFPEPDERVLVYTVEHTYGVWDAMPHRADNYAWEDEAGLYHNKWEVDMWMTLPEPLKGDEDE